MDELFFSEQMSLAKDFASMRSGVEQVAARGIDIGVDEVMLVKMLKHLAATAIVRLERVLHPYDLAETDFTALMQLFGRPDDQVSAGALCELTAQSPTNMTRIGDALVRKGLATRETDQADRRRVVLRITPQGEELARSLMPQLHAEVHSAFATLNASDKRQLERLLLRIATALDHRNEDSEP